MPPAAAAIGGGLLGGLAGLGNRRPPSLDPTQSHTLDELLRVLLPQAEATPRIDPIQQGLLYADIARSGHGAENRVTNSLVSRGVSRGGLLASGLTGVSQGTQLAQNQTNLHLQQQAIQQRNQTIQQILGLLGVGNIPGQSGFGAFMSGAAPSLAYGLSRLNFGSRGTPGSSLPGED